MPKSSFEATSARTPSGVAAVDLVARARALAPLIEAASRAIEQQREISPEVLTALHDARLFRLLLPRSCGGAEVEPAIFLQAIEALAMADGSTAWCVAQAAGCAVSAAYLRPDIAQEIFGGPQAVLAWGPPGRKGRASVVEGGYRVSGAWNFASGSRHAAWLGAHCPVHEADGTPRRTAEGKIFERTMLFPKAKAMISDVWHVVGLRGTGSDSYAVADFFVPEAYSFTRESDQDRRERGPLYRFTTFQLYAIGFAGVALGIARATLDAFIGLAKDKVPTAATKALRDSAVIQSQVALAEAQLQSARAFLLQTVREQWETALRGGGFTLEQRAAVRLASTFAIHQARSVVDTAYHAAGATAIFDSNPFERRFRDMHAVSQQVQGHFSNFELAGQCLLGLEPAGRIA